MKPAGLKFLIASVMIVELGGCSTGAGLHASLTSMNVGCPIKNMQISNERVDLNGNESWTAKCNGKTYDCNYFPEADSNCYLRDE